jgi:hypothetical protein
LAAATAFTQCEAAIVAAEQSEALPPGLLAAIGRVESGRFDAAASATRPWPWTINATGIGRVFDSKEEAVGAVRDLEARGVRSIDVGCMQVNLLHHGQAFETLEQAFDPMANAAYAARFLRSLYAESLDWPSAAAAYHSRTPDLGASYRQLVLSAWRLNPLPLADWQMRHLTSSLPAAVPPQLRPFVPPPLAADRSSDRLTHPGAAARLLAVTSGCAESPPAEGSAWTATARTSACGASPFATVSLLRRFLAEETQP